MPIMETTSSCTSSCGVLKVCNWSVFLRIRISEPTNSLHFRWSSKDVQGNEVLAQQISDLNSNI